MSKTIVSVLEIAAVVGLQFIPGLGQTVAGVLGITGATAAQTGLAVARIGLVIAEAGLNSVLFHSPKPESTEVAIKSSQPARVTAYGVVRLHYAATFA